MAALGSLAPLSLPWSLLALFQDQFWANVPDWSGLGILLIVSGIVSAAWACFSLILFIEVLVPMIKEFLTTEPTEPSKPAATPAPCTSRKSLG